jgi:cytochrome c oxidase subunit 4
MSTTTEHDAGHEAEHEAHEAHEGQPHKPDSYYVRIAVILAVITALETSTYWIDFGPFFMPMLLILMTIKFFMVVLFFMHLKEDAKIFGLLFYMGLGLALMVYLGALLAFQFFG